MAEAKKSAKTSNKDADISKEITEEVTTNGDTKETVQTEDQATSQTEEVKAAKAGKRSIKSQKEAAEKQAKEERKQKATEESSEEKPKQAQNPTRSRLERRGKKYRDTAKLVDRTKEYSLSEALELAAKTSPVKFNASVELHVKLGVDPRQADQNIRGTVSLPAGTGKNIRVAVFADADEVKAAKSAGADIAGSDEFLQQLDKEKIDFDVLISTPQMMAKLGKYARLLGPKGLMPNPKSGTVTKDVTTAVKEAKAGKVEYRVDSTGIIHLSVGKVDFKPEGLLANANAVVAAIKTAKPASIKSTYVQSAYITTTMGPSIRLSNTELQ